LAVGTNITIDANDVTESVRI